MNRLMIIIFLIAMPMLMLNALDMVFPQGGLKVLVPGNWEIPYTIKDDDSFTVMSPEGNIFYRLIPISLSELEIKTRDSLIYKYLAEEIPDFSSMESEESEFRGVETTILYGGGTVLGNPMGGAALLLTSDSGGSIMIFMGTEEGWASYESTFVEILSSITPY